MAKSVSKKKVVKREDAHPAHTTKIKLHDTFVIESAWEVCNQVGGIYTVIKSKIPAMMERWGDNYCLLGPLVNKDLNAEFEDISRPDTIFGKAAIALRKKGFKVRYGRWLVMGRPQVILFDPNDAFYKLNEIKDQLEKQFGIQRRDYDDLYNQVLAFADITSLFLKIFSQKNTEKIPLVIQFHEWMSVIPAFNLKKSKYPIRTSFTTHATLLGRYLAMNDKNYYSALPKYEWKVESERFHITSMVQIERKGAELADVFSTVSEVTGTECKYLLDKEPKLIVPNGLSISRFTAYHEVQNQHQKCKDEIHEFVLGHFFQSYSFNLDKTLYFFTSGRFEFLNKGFDITLEALKILNQLMKQAKVDTTIVMFFITKRPVWSINPDVLQSRGVMEEIRKNCEQITKQIDSRLFFVAAASSKDHRLPDLNTLVDDYWRLRYRRTIQSWKGDKWPIIVTHNLVDDLNDELLKGLRDNHMINSPDDKVKVVYHPDFISPTNPLFGIEYSDFVRGCHLGVFPSYYEPWGYTPLESIALGVPTITSDLSGFGDYVMKSHKEHDEKGVYILKRNKKSFQESAKDLADIMFEFVKKNRRERMIMRNKSEDFSESFDWGQLVRYYEKAFRHALEGLIT
ncbi:MAG: glycosyltransferase [Cyclobacteriaceae bacterium]|nr:glycosyltransferase [Cyclobacteriaceae bacterium]